MLSGVDGLARNWMNKRGRSVLTAISSSSPRKVNLPDGRHIEAFELIPEVDYGDLFRIYLRVSTVRAVVDVIAKAATARGWILEPLIPEASKENRAKIERLLRTPNPEDTFNDILFQTFVDLGIFGDAYWELVKDPKTGEVLEICTLDAMTTRILADEHGTVLGYIQVADLNAKPVAFGPNDVIHFRVGTQVITRGGRLGRTLYGLSPLESLLLPAETDIWAQIHNKAFFRNGAKVKGLYVMPKATRDQVERNREQLIKLSNDEFAHQDLLLEGPDVKFIPVGTAPRDMEFSKLREFIRSEIMSVYHTPPSIISIVETGNIGAGTGESQQENFREETVIPQQNRVSLKVDMRLFRQAMGIEDWSLRLRTPEIVSEKTQMEIDAKHVETGLRSVEEIRLERGWTPGVEFEKRLKPGQIAAQTGRTDRLVEIVNSLDKELKEEIAAQVERVARRFTEETRVIISKLLAEKTEGHPFEFRFSPYRHGLILFQKYTWPTFIKQANELEQAFSVLDPDELARIMSDNFIQVGQESLKDVGEKLKTQPGEMSSRIREDLLGNSKELSLHISSMISDTMRAEVIQGISEGESVSEISRRLRGVKELKIEVRTPGGGATTSRRRDFASIADTIARTETRRVFTAVAKEGFRNAGVTKVQWLTAPNPDDICEAARTGGENGVYLLGEVPQGGPPLHHNCRCTLQPVVEV